MDPMKEFSRQGVTLDGTKFRLFLNEGYQVCFSYPLVHVIPGSITDEQLLESSKFRTKNRFPSKIKCR